MTHAYAGIHTAASLPASSALASVWVGASRLTTGPIDDLLLNDSEETVGGGTGAAGGLSILVDVGIGGRLRVGLAPPAPSNDTIDSTTATDHNLPHQSQGASSTSSLVCIVQNGTGSAGPQWIRIPDDIVLALQEQRRLKLQASTVIPREGKGIRLMIEAVAPVTLFALRAEPKADS